MERYYFTLEDLEGLKQTMENIHNKVRDVGKEMGLSCQEGADTFHDNFAYEDGERQQIMLTRRYVELKKILNNAILAEKTDQINQAALGNVVTYIDLDTDEEKTIEIGSFMIFQENNGYLVSYTSPLGKMIIGAKKGDIKNGRIGGKAKKIEIIKIGLP